jgi:hypothetical protein
MANDNILNISITALCATPYSALVRHPELWDVMPKLCAGGARESTPASLLKDTQPVVIPQESLKIESLDATK